MAKPKIGRRGFIRLLALSGIGAGLALLNKITAPVGPVTFFRWMGRGKYMQTLGEVQSVALGECAGYQEDVLGSLRSLWQLAEMPSVQGLRVLVKPNLVDTLENHPATSAPEVVAAVVDLLRELGASQVTVGDGPAFRRDAWPVAEHSGLLRVLAERNVPFVDLNYDDPQPISIKKDWLRDSNQFWLPRHALEADLIVSVPKLKCHHWAGASLSLKNLLGLVPGARYGWPKNTIHINGITTTILGLYQILPPVVAVIDGIVGMEGDGPLFGTAVAHGLLAVGRDPVAVDATCVQLMGFEPGEIEYLAMATWAGVGQATRIETRGVRPERLRRQYKRPPSI